MSFEWYITPEEYQHAKQNGISAHTLDRRIRSYAWPKEKAINTPPQKRRKFDRVFAELAKQNGISRQTFRLRICVFGWDQERAATQPLQNRKSNIVLLCEKRRIFPKEILNLAIKNGIKRNTFYVRIRRGMSPEEAATKPVENHAEKSVKGGKALAQKTLAARRREFKRRRVPSPAGSGDG
ncbi:MAG: hypothetical protein HGA49_11675 [Eubacteriaceae bacterium]|nr:hypothetical protein [Eubacteriaceae bacterium]